MKKVFKLSLLFFAFTLFTNVALAQSTAKEDAMGQTKALKEAAGFDMDQFKPVYAVYLKYDRKLEGINKHIKPDTMAYMEAIEKLEVVFNSDMKKILTEEQFKIFTEKEKLKG